MPNKKLYPDRFKEEKYPNPKDPAKGCPIDNRVKFNTPKDKKK